MKLAVTLALAATTNPGDAWLLPDPGYPSNRHLVRAFEGVAQALLAQVAPHGALISRGQHNAFGHPHAEVLARYRAVSADLYDSVEQGAVLIRLGVFAPAQGLRHRARFWREK